MKETIYSLLNAYAQERTIMEIDSECLTWTGRFQNHKGSSRLLPVMKTIYTKGAWHSVTRYAWELVRSELSRQDRLRNTCGNLACINPYHYENMSKVCPNGHKRTPENLLLIEQLWVDAKGEPQVGLTKHCRPCKRIDVSKRYWAKKAARAA
jgi:hypothetical protein